ncbi:MAG: gliding motility-associated C-terminal domain-containing protein [Treponema sp.]|nr:gliding motility-associated C-terminal domain-containing protein [Treponema sp.]
MKHTGRAAFTRFLLLSVFLILTIAVYAETPRSPLGADAVPDLYAPDITGPGGFTTTQGGAPASALNPAQAGDAQRIVFDLGYMGLAGAEKKYGNIVDAGALFPTRYGVFGGTLRFINSPFNGFPLKNTLSGNISAAKELYPRMLFGAGLNFGVGEDWTLSADLGFRYNIGTLGPFHNFTWALALRGLGKSYYPTWFTPAGGISLDLVRLAGAENKPVPLVITASSDISFPSTFYFPQFNMIMKAGLTVSVAELVNISLSWPGASGLNIRELVSGNSRERADFQPIPSVGIGINIKLPVKDEKHATAAALPADGDLALDTAMKPLYNGIYAFGLGATWTVGVADKKPPVIDIDYPDTMYFSPNNDGKADNLEVPVTITDSRYVDSWIWEIRDENGSIIRTYRNKDLRPETRGMKNFISRLTAVKAGVDVPPVFRWDGIADSGELAPDGTYLFTITATDDSGNTATSEIYKAVLDNTPPEISIAPISDTDKIFSPDGDGNKDTITFVPTGSEEDAWYSGIWNAAGAQVRTFAAERGRPSPRIWDGTDDSGMVVSDGVYNYKIYSIDRAQNRAIAVMDNIIVNTVQPRVNLFIGDSWFSPNGDGIKDTIFFDFRIPVNEGITGWTMNIRDMTGQIVRVISGTADDIPSLFEYDGYSDSGKVLDEGAYQAELLVNYRNGYVSQAFSPNFNLRVTPPNATVRAEYDAFSPNNDGIQDEMIIHQEGSNELVWTGDIRRAVGVPGERPVRSFRFSGVPAATISWDGHGDAGTKAVDGEYTYELYSTDPAGNTGRSNIIHFTLNTADTPLMLSTDLRAFSPNGDGVKDTINITPHIQVTDGIVSYRLDILDSSQNTVWTRESTGVPPGAISWDGKTTLRNTAPDGQYTAKLELRYVQGNRPQAVSLPFTLDTQAPKAELFVPYSIFSPNNDGKRDTLPISITCAGDDEWTAAIIDANGKTVRSWNWQGSAPTIAWDGKDQAGNNANDGVYQFTLKSEDEAGNSFSQAIPGIILDARIPRVILTASATAIAPKEKQDTDMVRFSIICPIQEGIESWNLELKDDSGTVLRRFGPAGINPNATGNQNRVPPPPAAIGWNGLTENGALREGTYTPTLTVNYIKGDSAVAQAAPITVDVSGPVLSFASHPDYFSPDNDGVDDELIMSLGAQDASPIATWSLEINEPQPPYQLFYRVEGKGSPAGRIIWDGRSNKGELVQSATDYPVTYTATDVLGNTSTMNATIGVDVLVIRDGDRLRIQVPSIIFRENAADFDSLGTAIVDNNLRVLKRIAEILNKFKEYKVQVEGHANPVLRTEAEEKNELQPLSEARARAVVNMLIEFGVNRTRLSFIGMGGTKPVVSFNDRDNWWKNRRVEFLLIK